MVGLVVTLSDVHDVAAVLLTRWEDTGVPVQLGVLVLSRPGAPHTDPCPDMLTPIMIWEMTLRLTVMCLMLLLYTEEAVPTPPDVLSTLLNCSVTLWHQLTVRRGCHHMTWDWPPPVPTEVTAGEGIIIHSRNKSLRPTIITGIVTSACLIFRRTVTRRVGVLVPEQVWENPTWSSNHPVDPVFVYQGWVTAARHGIMPWCNGVI